VILAKRRKNEILDMFIIKKFSNLLNRVFEVAFKVTQVSELNKSS
jgi:hypothetical protein